MDSYLLAKKALILSFEADMQGYLAANHERASQGLSLAYTEQDFTYLSSCLQELHVEILNHNGG